MSVISQRGLQIVCLLVADVWIVGGMTTPKGPAFKTPPSIINQNENATMESLMVNTADERTTLSVTDQNEYTTVEALTGYTADERTTLSVTDQNAYTTVEALIGYTADERTTLSVTDQNENATMEALTDNTTDEIKTSPSAIYQNEYTTKEAVMRNTTDELTPPSVTDNGTFIDATTDSSMISQSSLNETQFTTDLPTEASTDHMTSTSASKNCDEALGLSNGLITDDLLMTSSSAAGQEKEKIRLDCCTDELGASWCPDDNDVYPWIEIRLPQPKLVSAILFQHPSLGKMSVLPSNYVKSVTVSYVPAGAVNSNHFVTFHKGMLALNSTTAFKIKLNIYTEKIRIHPDTWHGLACFRAELYGCYLKDYGTALATVVHCRKDGTEDEAQCVPEHRDLYLTSGNAANLVNQCQEPLLYLYENSCAQLPVTLTCFRDPDSCPDGFTISINVKLETEAPRYLLSTSREHRHHTGVTLFYQNDILMAAVQLKTTTWLVSTLHTLTAGKWHWLEISWTKSHGLSLYAEGNLIATSASPSPTETSRIHSDHMKIGCSDDTHFTYGGMWMKKLLMAPLSREQLLQSSPYMHNAKGLPDSICGVMTPPTILPTKQITAEPTTENYGTPTNTNRTTSQTGSTEEPVTGQQETPTAYPTIESSPSTTTPSTAKPKPSTGPECNDPMWGKYFTVFDVTTSSNGHNTSAGSAMTDCCVGPEKGGWCPDPEKLNSSVQFIEVKFKHPIGIQSIEIQPPEINSPTFHLSKYMTSYYVQYEPLNGHSLITMSTVSGPVLMRGVDVNGFSIVSAITTIPGIVTKRLRIVIEGYHREPCLRFQLFGCERHILCPSGCQNGGKCIAEDRCKCPVPFFGNRCEKTHIVPGRCRKPLGMSDGTIRDDQIQVSSYDNGKFKTKARYGCCIGEHNGAWCPHPNDTSPYYEVFFTKEKLISEIMFDFPSRKNLFDVHDTYLKTFSIFYQSNGNLHLYASNLQAIYNSTVTFTDDLDPYIRTDVIRIVPETWEKAACFRFELIGCDIDEGPMIVGKRRRRGLRPRVNLKINN